MPSLRSGRLLPILQNAFRGAGKERFRVLAFSIQRDHLHLVVEADEATGFVRGIQGLVIRIARAVNGAFGRTGRVFGDRYHAHRLATPRQVRAAFVYVLNNFRKHVRAVIGLDPYSSAWWFDGWATPIPRAVQDSPVVAARTWLGRVGWRRRGPIHPDEAPRAVHGVGRRAR